jgi:hypothetical protein
MLNLSFNLAKPTVARVTALILNFDPPGHYYWPLVPYCLMQPLAKTLFVYFLAGCVGRSFAYVAHFVFLRDV